jgi:hypothetical protein
MNGTGRSMSIWRRNMKYRLYGRILVVVLLMSFWKIPVYGEPLTGESKESGVSGMRFYNESEVRGIIEELTMEAEAALETAAAEAARAAALASLEREAAALAEARRLQGEYKALKSRTVKTALLTGVMCLLSGLTIGAGGLLIIQGAR